MLLDHYLSEVDRFLGALGQHNRRERNVQLEAIEELQAQAHHLAAACGELADNRDAAFVQPGFELFHG
jgi:hypothetical protein